MAQRLGASLAIVLVLTVGMTGCFRTGPCRPREESTSSADIEISVPADLGPIQAHFNRTGWETTTETLPRGFTADREWNSTLHIFAVVSVYPKSVIVTLRGPTVLTPEEARENLTEAANSIGTDLARFLNAPTPTIEYDGGTIHCGAV